MMITQRDEELLIACASKPIDFALVERLLKEGANPLGAVTNKYGDADNLYTIIVSGYYYNEYSMVDFLRISDLFMRHGMDLSKPTIPYDHANIIHPLWYFRFYDEFVSEKFVGPLKWLLDSGLDADSAMEFWDHFFTDIYLDCFSLDDEFAYADLYENLHKLLICVSYPHVLERKPILQREIWYADNTYDLTKFRNWEDYSFLIDPGLCINNSQTAFGAGIHVIECATEKEVWYFRLGYGSDGKLLS